MDIYTLVALVIGITTAIALLNQNTIRLPDSIGLMFFSFVVVLAALVLQSLGLDIFARYAQIVAQKIDFHTLLINGLLSYLLFAGAMSIDIRLVLSHAKTIALLSSLSVILSTILLGSFIFFIAPPLGVSIPLLICLLFGALIAPTDPIAVLATFKKLQAPASLSVILAGESLLNDGVGIVVFVTLYHLSFLHEPITWQHVSYLFFSQALGGLLYGTILGFIGEKLMRMASAQVAMLVTITIASTGYILAKPLQVSGPLAMVAAGIFIGNKLRTKPLIQQANDLILSSWDLIDEVLNAILFLLLGLQVLISIQPSTHFALAIISIPAALLTRLISTWLPSRLLLRKASRPAHFQRVLTWGGLRGGLAVALALSLPPSSTKSAILSMTFMIVSFSVLVQGNTIKYLLPSRESRN